MAKDIVQITLNARDGHYLPAWSAGANIHVPVGEYGSRQYSICSSPVGKTAWKLAVLREAAGTGGSRFVHEKIHAGMPLQVRLPRNRFQLKPAQNYLFIAGGIGITPIMSMLHTARSTGIPYRLVYLGSSVASMAFAEELKLDEHVILWPKYGLGRFGLVELIRNASETETIYACGPPRLLAALQELCAEFPVG